MPVAHALDAAVVRVENYRYADADGDDRTHVPPGGTVRWEWRSGGVPHTVTQGLSLYAVGARGGGFESGWRTEPAAFEVRFDAPGVYRYACSVHPSMEGLIVVDPVPAS